MKFQPLNCNIMHITRKRIKKISASYNLEGTVLDNIENIKYLEVTISNDLKWNTHISNICTKANSVAEWVSMFIIVTLHHFSTAVKPLLGCMV